MVATGLTTKRRRHSIMLDTREKFALAFYRTLDDGQRSRIDGALARWALTRPSDELGVLEHQIDVMRLNKNTSIWFTYFLNAGPGGIAPVGRR